MLTIGIDEVGRGSLAGPLVIAIVALNDRIAGLADSKILSAQKRETLTPLIKQSAIYYTTGWVWPREIDQLGLTKATSIAIQRALIPINKYVTKILLDGNYNFLKDQRVTTIIKGDRSEFQISAASIIAKVTRDNFMVQLNNTWKGYGFNTNVGYGTKEHLSAIQKLKLSPQHRRSFIKNSFS